MTLKTIMNLWYNSASHKQYLCDDTIINIKSQWNFIGVRWIIFVPRRKFGLSNVYIHGIILWSPPTPFTGQEEDTAGQAIWYKENEKR